MTSLVTRLISSYNDLIENRSDPRVSDWFMMSSPWPPIFITLTYVYFVTNLGPKIMANRKPIELKKTLLAYNFGQVLLSGYIFNESIVCGWGGRYSLKCEPVDYSNSPLALRMAAGCWVYYMSKFTELADTLFFVLRKKNNQITLLHVFHHGIMPVLVWFGVKFAPGGSLTFFGMINAFVHIWMYLYYFLAAFGPSIQPYLWWKKYLTRLQIIQFGLVLMHSGQFLFVDCSIPKILMAAIGLQAIVFLFMFTSFYIHAYRKNMKKDNHAKNNVASTLEPHRRGIKQSDIWASNFERTAKKQQKNGTRKQKSTIYANDYKVATSYVSDEGLRNRVFIDKVVSTYES